MAAAPTATPARRGPPFPWLKPAIIAGSGVPLAWMALRAAQGQLGANPVAEALNQLGLLTLVFLIGSLSMTPLKVLFGWSWTIRVRRPVGVTAFVYACLHFGLYSVVDQGLDLGAILADIGNRQFIFVGFAALLLLVPLAVTSTNKMVRRLGFERWQRIHYLGYVAGILGVVHFLMRVKKDPTEPILYGAILFAGFIVRALEWQKKRARKAAKRRQSPPMGDS